MRPSIIAPRRASLLFAVLSGIGLGFGFSCQPEPRPAPSTGGAAGIGGAGGVGGAVAGSAGLGGNAGGSLGGTGAMAGVGGGAGAGAEFAENVDIQVHPDVSTLLVVTWEQRTPADEVWLEFGLEGEPLMTSRPKPGNVGPHRDVVIGVPGDVDVTLRIVAETNGEQTVSSDYVGHTEAVPSIMPLPTVLAYDETGASPDRWLLGSVEDSRDQACAGTFPNCYRSNYYVELFWLYIIDRQGRVVWYYADPSQNTTPAFQRAARDGEYLWVEHRPYGGSAERGVLKMTLDRTYFEPIPVPQLSDCIDVTEDGSLLFDTTGSAEGELREMDRDGNISFIWSCRDHFGAGFNCYSNTVNYNPADNTVLLSYPYEETVIEIQRDTGEVVGQYGAAPGSYAFSPDTWSFGFQHFANITPSGTLLLSSHMPGLTGEDAPPTAGQHAFMEFTIDRDNETLLEEWIYNAGPEWAMFKGMAMRLANGNTLANYGTGGVIREITPSMDTVFHVKFDNANSDDFMNKMVGNNFLLDDLYSLNGGGPQ